MECQISPKKLSLNHLMFIFFLTETWVIYEKIDELVPVGSTPKKFRLLSAKVNDKRRGGSLLIYNPKDQETEIESFENYSLEFLLLKIMAGRNPNIFYHVYDHRRHLSLLSVGISNLVTHYRSCFERIFILGDCNIHFNNPLDYKTAKFLDAMLEAGVKKMAFFHSLLWTYT